MMFSKTLRDQKGMSTILIVMAISMIILVTLGSAQMYIESRARFHSRIRLAYKYSFIMEDAAKMVLNGRLAFQANSACPGSTARPLRGSLNVCLAAVGNPSPRCIVDPQGRAACVCEDGLTDPQCADSGMAFMENFIFDQEKNKTWVVRLQDYLKNKKNDMQDIVALGVGKLFRVPDVPKPAIYENIFGEKAVAATMAMTIRGIDTVPVPVGSSEWAPNDPPGTTNQARTTFTCAPGLCYVLRVCINNIAEPMVVPAGDVLCMEQRIARGNGVTPF